MKKSLFTFALLIATVIVLGSCGSDSNSDDRTVADIETRAKTLGFDSTEAYVAYVHGQCAQGNHRNCDIHTDGTHEPCSYVAHNGQHHDGRRHDGTDHRHHDNHHNGGHH